MPEKHTFQTPRGTRDFYPEDMAIRRYIETVWREVSVNHGFDEIEGPMFEHLDLYTVKSGEGIVSELFSFQREGGDTRYALRPEFTPSLARMYAAKAAQLPKPTKWFVIPNHFRAERPQRGRLREFIQWNIDVIGDDSPAADAEVIACTVGILERLGLIAEQVKIRISDRNVISSLLRRHGVKDETAALSLLDKRDRLDEVVFAKKCEELGLVISDYDRDIESFEILTGEGGLLSIGGDTTDISLDHLQQLFRLLETMNLRHWCDIDFRIVRGLAYYTGTVFEVHETTGKERAIAGGGRYDHLIELFGGPSTPAVGIAMGDVVLRLVLEDHGLLDDAKNYMPRCDVFVIAAKEEGDTELKRLVAKLRRLGLHVRHSYRATRNIGKLLGDARKARAKCAVILGDELADGFVTLKNLDSGSQETVGMLEIEKAIEGVLNPDRE